ncbi:MAG: GtrA family protein [Clostridia bacterium]|nr:GtrA family protein [Clostridia bacterium]
MKTIKVLFSKYRELIIYFVFGVFTTLVNLITFHLFSLLLGNEHYLVSNVVAWIASVIFAYITNKIWVFESKSWSVKVLLREIPSFFSARVLSFAVEEVGLFLLVDIAGMSVYGLSVFGFNITGELIAKVILAVIVVILNYIFSKFLIFRKR